MKCSKCSHNALEGAVYAGKNHCEKHFLELIERRIRKNLRTRKLIDVKKEYYFADDKSSEAKLTEYFLDKIFLGRLKLSEKKSKSLCNIVPTNLDEQALMFLNSFLENKKLEKSEEVMPLEVVTQQEVELLCRVLKIKFVPRIKEDVVDNLEKRHPGTKFSLFQSRMKILEGK
ncbi:MAG: hypothetical protein ACP5N3_06305 [Candidatus Nanoarchaeia archaeon]